MNVAGTGSVGVASGHGGYGADAARTDADASRSGTDASRSGADASHSGADASRSGADASRSGAGRSSFPRAEDHDFLSNGCDLEEAAVTIDREGKMWDWQPMIPHRGFICEG